MARYDHLTVFQATYELNLYFFKLSRGFPKDYKYGLAAEIRELTSELLDLIIIANNSQRKTLPLAKASLVIERIKYKCRMLKDLKVMRLNSYEHFSKQLIDISRQIEKWQTWAKREESKSTRCEPGQT